MKPQRILIALIGLSAALSAASVSFSFAWYASATRLRVETIQIVADPNRSLLISNAEEGEYKEHLVKEDLNPIGFLTPVSTCFQDSWLGQEDMPRFYDMSFAAGNNKIPLRHEANPDGYFSQELWLKCDTDAIIGIDAQDTTITSDEEKNAEYASYLAAEYPEHTYEQHLERLNKAKDCGRVSVLVDDNYGIFDPNYNEEIVYFAGPLDNGNNRFYDTYIDRDDGREYEVCYGEYAEGKSVDDLVYAPVGDEDIRPSGEYTAFTANHKAGSYQLDFEASKHCFATEPRLGEKDLGPFDQDPLFQFNINAFEPKRIVVSFYLEGWDLDSVNGAMGASCDLNLSFKILRER